MVLYGGSGDDFLYGGVGDNFRGGAGNDYAYIDLSSLTIDINATLSPGVSTLNGKTVAGIERIELLAGSGNDTINTSGFTNTVNLVGGDGNDTLTSGLGNDLLVGGLDNDIFGFANANEGQDEIADFTVSTDILQISASGFGGGLSAGNLGADQILIGSGASAATSAEQRFIYNTANGALYFDADGNGSNFAAVHIATLSNRAAITNNDFLIV